MIENGTTKKAALLVSVIASFLFPFMGSSINIAIPIIGKEFQVDAVLLSWIATSFLLSAAVFLVPFGRLADIYGRKKMFKMGVIVYTLACILSGISPSIWWLLISRVINGIGGAMIAGTSIAILTSVFPPGERGRALGINTASVYLGLASGPFFGGLLTHYLSWRAIFYINIPIGLFVLYVLLKNLKGEWAEAKGEKFDLTGSIIYSITIIAVIFGFSKLPGKLGAGIILAGLIGFTCFVIFELKVSSPVLNLSLFLKNRVFAFSNLAALFNYGATFSVTFLMSLYLQYIKALSAQDAGIILMIQPIVQSALSPFSGSLSDKMEPRIVASIGMGITVIGLASLAFITDSTSIGFIIFSLILLGIGFALFSSPNTNAVMSSVEKKYLGIASATLATMRVTGQTFSMGMATMIFAILIGGKQITSEVYHLFVRSARLLFAISAVLCTIGVFSSMARGGLRRSN